MNKTAIKNFAVSARKKLMQSVIDACLRYGITGDGAREPDRRTSDSETYYDPAGNPSVLTGPYLGAREKILDRIRQLGNGDGFEKGFERFVEEAAYTWFNRIIAIRFMEVNDYLPTHTRVLSSETPGKFEPDIMSRASELEFDLSPLDLQMLEYNLANNQQDFAFRLLFVRQCNALSKLLPGLFEPLSDYTDLLLSISYTDPDGVVRSLLSIPEEDFNVSKGGQVEIIGWLYQYYNSELKDETFALLKQNVKITKERIPAATQLFTPDWIVRYMVENSLGRLWLEAERARVGLTDEYLNASYFGWKYYLEEAEQEQAVQKQLASIRAGYKDLRPEGIKVIDPCMGSGHILVYAFDLLMQVYESCGYTQRDAAQLIVEKNLYGLDIDDRAYQLAYFAIMMKGRQYDRRFLTRGVKLNLTSIQQSNRANANRDMLALFAGKARADAAALLDVFTDAKTYGSILSMPALDWDALENATKAVLDTAYPNIFDTARQEHVRYDLLPLIKQGKILAGKYDVVVTNPPYMGGSGMNGKLSEYVKEKYPDSKGDLFAVFIEKCAAMTKQSCYQAMITQHAWMFLSSFEKLRGKLLTRDTVNMAHLGARAFDEIGGEVVQATAFVQRNGKAEGYKGTYVRLVDIVGENEKRDAFLSGSNRFTAQQKNFAKIPGMPVAYWVSFRFSQIFAISMSLKEITDVKTGIQTGGNDHFVRLWHEIDFEKLGLNFVEYRQIEETGKKWYPYNKGGEFRKWYGNNTHVVNMEHNGSAIKSFSKNYRLRDPSLYFKPSVTWSFISSSKFGVRYCPAGFLFDVAGSSVLPEESKIHYITGFLSSVITSTCLDIQNPTMNYQIEDISNLPVIIEGTKKGVIEEIVKHSISISKTDWDSFETSWDFQLHPMLPGPGDCNRTYFFNDEDHIVDIKSAFLQTCFDRWQKECDTRFYQLKSNEEKLNRIFIEIYGLQDELSPEVEEKDVTVRRADLTRDIKSLISYAVGCMLGRYSLDVDGLAYAGGEWDDGKYKTYLPDKDNILPILDDEYFPDDIVGRFVEFIKTVYGENTLEENLTFIASALGGKGMPREVIRNYFLKDFYKDHVRIYQKRPIYWLFDSGKEDGFKALVYLHRYEPDTVGRIRTDYLHKTQAAIERAMLLCDAASPQEKGKAIKRKEKLTRQLAETRAYDQALAHVALQRIALDLDDGVKVNYAKFQGIEITNEGKKAQKVDLLAGI